MGQTPRANYFDPKRYRFLFYIAIGTVREINSEIVLLSMKLSSYKRCCRTIYSISQEHMQHTM